MFVEFAREILHNVHRVSYYCRSFYNNKRNAPLLATFVGIRFQRLQVVPRPVNKVGL